VRQILKTITEINIIIQLLLKRKIDVVELLNKTTRINAEALMSALQNRKGKMPRFKFQLTEEEAYQSLMVAIKVEVEYRHKEFVMNDELEYQVRHLSAFLTQESSKFGILLAGGCGNGKTTIIKALQNIINTLHIPNSYNGKEYAIRIIDAKSLAATCKSNYEDWKRLMYQDLLAIDDLETEPREVLDYRNIINPTVDILTRRYDNQLFTIISTNLTPPQISQVYEERIANHMREMMEIIPFHNSSYRSPK
jgi:DNA replication protein DnaC